MKNENKEIIEQLEERLKWYTYEASEEEFDAEEVYMISKLLQKIHENEEKDDYNIILSYNNVVLKTLLELLGIEIPKAM